MSVILHLVFTSCLLISKFSEERFGDDILPYVGLNIDISHVLL